MFVGQLRTTAFACAIASFMWPLALADEAVESTDTKVISVELFVKEMQLLARRNQPGKTKLEQEDTLSKLLHTIHDEFDGVEIEYDVMIVSVDWRSGMATIRTASPVPRYKPSRQLPFNITTTQPLSISMTREEAAAINSRKPLKFRGKLKFLDGKWGVVGRPPESQSLFWIRSEDYKQVISIGTFIAEDYAVWVGDDELFAVHPERAE